MNILARNVLIWIVLFLPALAFAHSNELAAQMDAAVRHQFADAAVPGGAVVVIEHGVPVLVRGYGFSDVAAKKTVSADATLFRVASLSKVFTAAAILQLVEQGKFSLEQDIRPLLPREIAQEIAGPLTVTELLTHTSGIDNSDIGDAAKNPNGLLNLQQQLSKMPGIAVPPKRLFHYSNYNFALAGLLIERATGRPFEEAMRDLLKKAGMKFSTFDPVLPPNLTLLLSKSYAYKDKRYSELPLDYSQVRPADGLFATASDMGRFLEALLEAASGGSFLSASVRDAMFHVHFAADPRLDSVAFPFFVSKRNGTQIFSYTGGQLGFTSAMVLVPEQKSAFFISYNRRISPPRIALSKLFLQLLVGTDRAPAQHGASTFHSSVDKYTGVYRYTGGTQTTIEKIYYLLGYYSDLKLSAESGTLATEDGKYQEVQPGYFCSSSNDCGIFRKIADDVYLQTGTESYRRIHWYEGILLHRLLILLGLLILVFAVFYLRGKRIFALPAAAIQMLRISAVLIVLFILFFSWFLKSKASDFDYGLPSIGTALLVFPLVSIVTTFGSLAYLPVLLHAGGSFRSKIIYAIAALFSATVLLQLWYWNLVGFHYPR